jgi:hypothetical protein
VLRVQPGRIKIIDRLGYRKRESCLHRRVTLQERLPENTLGRSPAFKNEVFLPAGTLTTEKAKGGQFSRHWRFDPN